MAIVLVTGCSSGFGEQIAAAFAARGDQVIATMRNPDRASDQLRAAAGIELAALDVTDAAQRERVLRNTLDRHGRLDVLVNNAGVVASGSVEDVPEDVARAMWETNYFAPVALMRAVLPIMRAQGGGRIVSITAIGAIISPALLGTYCATKHALDAIAASVDIEGRAFGVRAPSVLPGQFRTSIADNAPAPFVSAPYQAIADAMAQGRAERAADVQSDLTQVVDAVLAAATDPEPRARYLAGIGIALELEAALAEQERLQRWDAGRAGFG